MLLTFKSRASAEVVMCGEHATRILDILKKDHKQGVITAAETADAIQLLRAQLSLLKTREEQETSHAIERDVAAHHNEDGDDNDHEEVESVPFSTRVYPLLEMLRAANRENRDVLWGVLP